MSQFIYLLNAMERASQAEKPAEHGYAEKRRQLLEYVTKLEQATPSAPYGYLWFDRNMERRFNHTLPAEGVIGEAVPVYLAARPEAQPSNGLDAYNARDAARYRFLHHAMRMSERHIGSVVLRFYWDAPQGSSVFLEEAIDAAMLPPMNSG